MSKDTEAATVDVLRSAGGVVERDELRYQLDRRGMRADPDLGELIDKGLVEKVNGGFQAVVAPRPGKPRSRHNQLDDEELLDKVRLWAAIVGKPPTSTAWAPSRLNEVVMRQMATLRKRLEAWREIQRLYEEGDWPHHHTMMRRFGSMNAALALAGFEPRGPGNQPGVPRRPTAPQPIGQEALERRLDDIGKARGRTDPDRLRAALYDLAIAAMTEADRMGSPHNDDQGGSDA